MTGEEWLEDLNDEEVRKVARNVATARGHVKSALETLDGDGEKIRDELADAFQSLNWTDTAMKGQKSFREDHR